MAEVAKSNVRPRTLTRYEQYVRVHLIPTLGTRRLTKITPQQLQALYAQKLHQGLSPTTVAHLHTVLHRALRQAVRWGLVSTNVAELADPPRVVPREMRTLSADEARRFLQAAAEDLLEALYVLALTIGMRQGELLGLHWRDVVLDQSALRVRTALQQRTHEGFQFTEPKTPRSRRSIELTGAAVEALRRHKIRQLEDRLAVGAAWEDDDLVFPNGVGRPLEHGNLLRRSFRLLLERAGVSPIRFHDLRHTVASLLLSKGTHPKIVADMLGHSQVSITLDTYSHVAPALHGQAADTLDALLGS